MKKIIKLNMFVVMITVAMISCDEKIATDAFDGKVTAQLENGSTYTNFHSVKAVHKPEMKYGELTGLCIAETVYENGGFSITLPKTIADEHLIAVKTFFAEMLKIRGDIKYSNTDVRVFDVDFIPFDEEGLHVGGNFLYIETARSIYCFFVYATDDVMVTGSTNLTVSLKKGWNRLYYSSAGKGLATTKVQDGMKWIMQNWY